MRKFLVISVIFLSLVLRFYHLNLNPPSLYGDEASLGYNAFSILKTGRDEFGNFLPLTNFPAFGDYKPSGYIYAAVLFIKFFKTSELAIRFPSALFGTLTVLVTYFLAIKIFKNEIIGLSSSFFLAISPWHIQMSRAAFEANLGLFFSTTAIFLFVKFAKENKFYIFLSALLFLAAMYTFTGQRLFVPFIILILTWQFKKEILSNLRIVIIATLFAGILFWPLFKFATQTIEGRLRFEEVTIFKDLEPINKSTEYRDQDNFSWSASVIHNRRLFYLKEYLKHYFDAVNPTFLFTSGDVNPRLSIQEIGELYYFELPLILIGLFFLISHKHPYRFLIIGWLLISPLGPATARETPHALRMIHILPTYQFIAAYAIYNLYKLIQIRKIFITFSLLIFVLSIFYYLHMYYIHYPKEYLGHWQYGYKQAVQIVKNYINEADRVIVTDSLGRPYIYFLYYMGYDPHKFWQTAQVDRDQFFFIKVRGFDKFLFGDIESLKNESLGYKTIFVAVPGQLPESSQKIETITDLNNHPVFDIGKNY